MILKYNDFHTCQCDIGMCSVGEKLSLKIVSADEKNCILSENFKKILGAVL